MTKKDFAFIGLLYLRTKNGGERGIRTLGTLVMYTRFPSVLLKPLGHLSYLIQCKENYILNNFNALAVVIALISVGVSEYTSANVPITCFR